MMATPSLSSAQSSDPNLTAYSASDFSEYSRAESSYSEQVTDWVEDTPCESLDDKTFLTLDSTSNLVYEPPPQLDHEPVPNISFGETPLAVPIFKQDKTKLLELLKNVDCGRDAVDFQGRTGLHIACMLGNKVIAQLLIDHGWSRTACTKQLRTPLHEATICGHHQVIPLLAMKKSEVLNASDKYGQTPIHLAALHGEVLCLKELISLECCLSLQDRSGRLPTHLAAVRGHLNALKVLSERGVTMAEGDNRGRSPVHYSAEFGSLECLKYFYSNGLNLTLADADGWMPTHIAASTDQLDCLKYLLARGLKLLDSDRQGRNVAHVAAMYGSKNCLHWMLEKGASPDLKDKDNNSLAHFAAQRGNSSCINCIYHHGGAMASQNDLGLTPLQIAKTKGKVINWENGLSGRNCCQFCLMKEERNAKTVANREKDIYAKIRGYSVDIFSLNKVFDGRHHKDYFQLGKPRMPEGHKVLKNAGKESEETWLKKNLAAIYNLQDI